MKHRPLEPSRRQRTPVLGVLYPGGILTKEGVMRRAGIGLHGLQAARRSGIVKPISVNDRLYYRTDELIAWIESHANEPE